jgi:hypothetical protein
MTSVTSTALIEESADESLRAPVLAGVLVGILQAFSPIVFWWLHQDIVWAVALPAIAFVYIGFAVADGRPSVLAVETVVAMGFVVVACVAITVSPWLVVVGLVGHGLKDLWQHRTHFVANTRWWPPFCAAVDFIAAALIAVMVIAEADLTNWLG